jgi:Cu/Ag efflux pump CusA
MKFYKVSMSELSEICKGISQNSTGGVLREFGNEYVVRGIARSSNLDELANTYITLNPQIKRFEKREVK